jgi:foldase protein PrsA
MELGRRDVMIAKDLSRAVHSIGFVLVVMIVAAPQARAQQNDPSKLVPPPAPRVAAPASKPAAAPKNLSEIDVPGLAPTMVPVNPTDAIAIVNKQKITRQQLADECVARKGKEILELLINRTLIEQALRQKKLEVTAAEIDQEIETVAKRFGIGREAWLRTLDKERNISPVQYARDVIYPALALRKLCAGRVQVTPDDMQKAFEAQFAEKLRCRMILVDTQQKAIQIWEDLRKNPAGFEAIAKDQSMDTGSRGLGGLLAEPITRHAYPQTISDAAFRQLVDGDPLDKDPSHKPKDGDFTGPIQVEQAVWIILRRESVVPAIKDANLKDERVRKQTYELIYEVKLKEAMGLVFQELVKASEIENQLAGTVKLANEEKNPDYGVDHDVKLMSNPPEGKASAVKAAAPAAAAPRGKLAIPTALSPEAAEEARKFERPLKPPSDKTDGAGGQSTTTTTSAAPN